MHYDSTYIVLLARLMSVPRTLLACGPSIVPRPPAAIPHIADDTLHEIPSRIGSVAFRNHATYYWNPDTGARAFTHRAPIQRADILNAALTDELKDIYAYSLRTDAEGAKAYRPIRIRWASGHPYDPPSGRLHSASFEDGPHEIDDGAAAIRSRQKFPESSQSLLLADQQTITENVFRAGLVVTISVVVVWVIRHYMRRKGEAWRLDTEKWPQRIGLG